MLRGLGGSDGSEDRRYAYLYDIGRDYERNYRKVGGKFLSIQGEFTLSLSLSVHYGQGTGRNWLVLARLQTACALRTQHCMCLPTRARRPRA